jgi:hypothetical protein
MAGPVTLEERHEGAGTHHGKNRAPGRLGEQSARSHVVRGHLPL